MARKIRALKLKGIIIEPEPDRFYPNNRLASTTLGFTGLDNEGLSGIEYFLNTELSGIDADSRRGSDIFLTISSFLQRNLEKHLLKAYKESESQAASAVLIDATSGDILAMVSLPDYDPNFAKDSPSSSHRNRSISDAYEPGSTFKSFIFSGANERTSCSAKKRSLSAQLLPGKPEGFPVHASMVNRTSLRSLKTPAMQVSSKLVDTLSLVHYNVILRPLVLVNPRREPTSSKFRQLETIKQWDEWLSMTIPIGHGLSASTLQMASAGLVIANDGVLPGVSIIQTLKSADGNSQHLSKSRGEVQIIDPDAAKVTRELLAGVVSPSGTGKRAAINDSRYHKFVGKQAPR